MTVLAYLIISQIFYLAGLVLWPVVAIMSVMAFDNGVHPGSVLLVTWLGIYPILAIGSAVTAWILRRKRTKVAAWINAIPLMWAVCLPIPFLLG